MSQVRKKLMKPEPSTDVISRDVRIAAGDRILEGEISVSSCLKRWRDMLRNGFKSICHRCELRNITHRRNYEKIF
jgi:hypothetical protein